MNRKQKSSADVFWLPILIFKGVWFLIKLMFLGMTHISDCRECEKMLYSNPKRVSYSARQGVELARLGQSLFACIALVLLSICIHMAFG